MTSAADYCAELSQKIAQFFSDQQQGLDIPPALLYRFEGFVEAGLLMGYITETEVKRELVDGAQYYLNTAIAEFYQQDFRLILHMRMREAPVYASSPES
jgi:hypothetical protein|tara:strand:- start:1713 stop:2009 length:297 start_codon:yes stop_codon:yes gene_type:complete